ncbi:MAG: SxtJ family membrane protein [Pseudomonadota bacterium]
MKMVNINWNPDKAELRKFGLTMLIGFSIIAAVAFFVFEVSKNIAIGLVIFGAVSLVLSYIGRLGMIIYYPWMTIGMIMGTIVSHVILAVLFFGIVTPIGLVFKIMRRDSLQKNVYPNPEASSWTNIEPIENTIEAYQRQF